MKRCSEDTGKIQRKTLREEEDGQTDALLNGGTSLIRINSAQCCERSLQHLQLVVVTVPNS